MEIESIRKRLARAADTGHSNSHNAQGRTPFWKSWRWLFGDNILISLQVEGHVRAVTTERGRRIAFAMGMQERLGALSLVSPKPSTLNPKP